MLLFLQDLINKKFSPEEKADLELAREQWNAITMNDINTLRTIDQASEAGKTLNDTTAIICAYGGDGSLAMGDGCDSLRQVIRERDEGRSR